MTVTILKNLIVWQIGFCYREPFPKGSEINGVIFLSTVKFSFYRFSITIYNFLFFSYSLKMSDGVLTSVSSDV